MEPNTSTKMREKLNAAVAAMVSHCPPRCHTDLFHPDHPILWEKPSRKRQHHWLPCWDMWRLKMLAFFLCLRWRIGVGFVVAPNTSIVLWHQFYHGFFSKAPRLDEFFGVPKKSDQLIKYHFLVPWFSGVPTGTEALHLKHIIYIYICTSYRMHMFVLFETPWPSLKPKLYIVKLLESLSLACT